MNKRIKYLAEQANIYIVPNSKPISVGGTITDLEKFAELIIQECIRIADFHNDCNPMDFKTLPAWNIGYLQCAEDISDRIKEHFGFEE